MACAPSEDSDQPGHPPSLITVFAVRMKKAWVLSNPKSAQRRLWSDWADQADLSLRWAHSHFVGFVTRRLKCVSTNVTIPLREEPHVQLSNCDPLLKSSTDYPKIPLQEFWPYSWRVEGICVFQHSVMTNFNCACPAIQRGQGSGFLSEGSSWLTACMSEQWRFWWDWADVQARLNLRCSHRR